MTEQYPTIDDEDVRAFMIKQFRAKHVETPQNKTETSTSSPPPKLSKSKTVLGYTLNKNEYLLEDNTANAERSFHATNAINDQRALEAKLEEICYQPPKGLSHVPWIETLALTSSKTCSIKGKTVDHGQDIEREKEFYTIALNEVQEGLRRLKTLGIPFERPMDYLAEMLKSDKQMQAIRGKMAALQQRLAHVEKCQEARRVQRWQRAAGMATKNSQRVKAQQQAVKRKHFLQEVEQWKRKRKKGKEGVAAFPPSVEAPSAEAAFDQQFSSREEKLPRVPPSPRRSQPTSRAPLKTARRRSHSGSFKAVKNSPHARKKISAKPPRRRKEGSGGKGAARRPKGRVSTRPRRRAHHTGRP